MFTVTEPDELETIFTDHPDKLIVIDFSAGWCGPCRKLKPVFHEAVKNESLIGVEVDVDDSPELTEKYGVSSLPTVAFYRGGKHLGDLIGCNIDKFNELINELK